MRKNLKSSLNSGDSGSRLSSSCGVRSCVLGASMRSTAAGGKESQTEAGCRKNNTGIFVLEGVTKHICALTTMMKLLWETMKLETLNGNFDYVTILLRRKGHRPILVKCTFFSVKLKILINTKIKAGSQITEDAESSFEIKKMRRCLIQHLKDAK
jgi:hypothetical protein